MGKLSIHPDTRLGPVHLSVSDLTSSLNFYSDVLSLKIIKQDKETVTLSADNATPLLTLTEISDLSPKEPKTLGLYHYALLVPTRYDLARILHRLLELLYPVQGASDHLVSESIYLSDPDGNGVEIYYDLPRDEWPYDNGKLQMDTNELDLDLLLAELGKGIVTWSGLPVETLVGHIHLHVPDLEIAKTFYHEVLGFDLIMQYGPGVLFFSAGGYHHHIGFNTWAGTNPQPSPKQPDYGISQFIYQPPKTSPTSSTL